MQIATVLVLTEFFGIGFEVASGIALVLWIITFVMIVPVGLVLAFHEGLKWRNLRHWSPEEKAIVTCPFCGHRQDRVIDSRESKEGDVIRRRRECLNCERRFTTYERSDEIPYMVVKRDGRREKFDRQKVLEGLLKACEKRPVAMAKLAEAGGRSRVEAGRQPGSRDVDDGDRRAADGRSCGRWTRSPTSGSRRCTGTFRTWRRF